MLIENSTEVRELRYPTPEDKIVNESLVDNKPEDWIATEERYRVGLSMGNNVTSPYRIWGSLNYFIDSDPTKIRCHISVGVKASQKSAISDAKQLKKILEENNFFARIEFMEHDYILPTGDEYLVRGNRDLETHGVEIDYVKEEIQVADSTYNKLMQFIEGKGLKDPFITLVKIEDNLNRKRRKKKENKKIRK